MPLDVGATPLTSSAPPQRSPLGGGGPDMLRADHFIKLLITQMKYQDPEKPMEIGDMMAQLAQVSQVQQGTETNRHLARMHESLAIGHLDTVASWAGREVDAEGPVGSLKKADEGHQPKLAYRLDKEAERIEAEILGPDGQTVRRLQFGGEELPGTFDPSALSRGQHELAWDGRDADGTLVPAGDYRVAMRAFDHERRAVPVFAEAHGRIDAVEVVDGQPKLHLNGGLLDPSQVRRFHPR